MDNDKVNLKSITNNNNNIIKKDPYNYPNDNIEQYLNNENNLNNNNNRNIPGEENIENSNEIQKQSVNNINNNTLSKFHCTKTLTGHIDKIVSLIKLIIKYSLHALVKLQHIFFHNNPIFLYLHH